MPQSPCGSGTNRNVCYKMLWMGGEKNKLPKEMIGKVWNFVYATEALNVYLKEVRHGNSV